MDRVAHYRRDGRAFESIVGALVEAGIDVDHPPISPAAVSGADEFHLGGAAATAAVLEGLVLGVADRVLDVGCGVGGPARSIAAATGCHVTGIDLTPSFVEAATRLSELVGLADATSFRLGDARHIDDPDGTYAAATMFHVGMNLPDKAAVFAEIARVLRPGGSFVVYDVMRTGPGDLDFPLPWSSDPGTSHLATPDEYRAALDAAGFRPAEPIDRGQLVASVLARAAADPPPVSLVHLMGPGFPTMIANLRAALGGGTVSPVQITARR